MKNGQWLGPYLKSCIETHLIPLIKVEPEELHATHIIKVKFQIHPSQATLETYKINISTFNDGQSEEFLALLRNFNIETDGAGTTTSSGCINYLRTMLRGTSLRELNKLALAGNSTANHLKHIMEGLL